MTRHPHTRTQVYLVYGITKREVTRFRDIDKLMIVLLSSDRVILSRCGAIASYRVRVESKSALWVLRLLTRDRRETGRDRERRKELEEIPWRALKARCFQRADRLHVSTECKEWHRQGMDKSPEMRERGSREKVRRYLFFSASAARETVRRRDVNVTPQLVREHA